MKFQLRNQHRVRLFNTFLHFSLYLGKGWDARSPDNLDGILPLLWKLHFVPCALALSKSEPDYLHKTWVTQASGAPSQRGAQVDSVANENRKQSPESDSSCPSQMPTVGCAKTTLSLDSWNLAKEISHQMCNILDSLSQWSISAVLTPLHFSVCTSNYFSLHFQTCLRHTLGNFGSLIPSRFLQIMAKSPMRH